MASEVERDGSKHGVRGSAIHGAKWAVVDKWFSKAFSFAAYAVLARVLQPKDFGLLALATVTITFLNLFVDTGTSEAVIQAEVLTDELRDTAFVLSLLAGLILFGIGLAIALPVADLYDQPALRTLLPVLMIGVPLQALVAVQQALLQRTFEFRKIALRRLVSAVLGGIVGVVWAVVSPTVWALAAQYLVQSVTAVVVLWTVSPYRPGRNASRQAARRIAAFGLHVLGIRVFTFITEQGDNFIVGVTLGPVALGYYAIGYRVFSITTELVTMTLSTVALPTFARLQHDSKRMADALLAATRVSVTLAAPFFLSLSFLAPELVPALFGAKWHTSIPVMQILGVVGLLNSVMFFDRGVLVAAGRVRLELFITAGEACCNLVAFYVGAFWGIDGVATALALRAYAFWPIRVASLHRVIGVRPSVYLLQWFKPVLCAAITVGVMCIGLLLSGIARFATELIVGVLSYIALLLIVAKSNLFEILQLLQAALGRRPTPSRSGNSVEANRSSS